VSSSARPFAPSRTAGSSTSSASATTPPSRRSCGATGGDDNGGGDQGDNSGPGSDNSGPGHDGDDDRGDRICTTAELVPGAVAEEAELKVRNGQATFHEVELSGREASNS
jgi:hypothetical protein